MAFSKLQRDVADIYEQARPDPTPTLTLTPTPPSTQLGATERGVTYEELAAALVELGLFKTASAAPTAADDNQVLLQPEPPPPPSPAAAAAACVPPPARSPYPYPYPYP